MGHGRSWGRKLKNIVLKGLISLQCPMVSRSLGRRELLDPVRAGTPRPSVVIYEYLRTLTLSRQHLEIARQENFEATVILL